MKWKKYVSEHFILQSTLTNPQAYIRPQDDLTKTEFDEKSALRILYRYCAFEGFTEERLTNLLKSVADSSKELLIPRSVNCREKFIKIIIVEAQKILNDISVKSLVYFDEEL